MEEAHKGSPMHWILAASLVLSGVFVIAAIALVNNTSKAAPVTTQVGVQNADPTVVNIALSNTAYGSEDWGGAGGTIDVVPGGTRSLNITGEVRDENGAGNIDTVAAVLRHENATNGDSCTDDSNDCYQVHSCTTQAGANSNQLEYNCSVSLDFWADSTSAGGPNPGSKWQITVDVEDNSSPVGSGTLTQDREMGTSIGLDFPNTLDFGSRVTPSTSTAANNVTYAVQQHANDEQDYEVSMTNATLNCTDSGDIDRDQIQHSATDVDYDNPATTDLTGSPAAVGITVGYRTDDANPLFTDSFWNVEIDSEDVARGTCSAPATFTAIAK